MQQVLKLAQGNPGAMTFLMQLNNSSVPKEIKSKIADSGIVGTDLYVLWSDLCGRNMDVVATLVDKCPLDVLKDACSRQDYSGRELVKEYLN